VRCHCPRPALQDRARIVFDCRIADDAATMGHIRSMESLIFQESPIVHLASNALVEVDCPYRHIFTRFYYSQKKLSRFTNRATIAQQIQTA